MSMSNSCETCKTGIGFHSCGRTIPVPEHMLEDNRLHEGCTAESMEEVEQLFTREERYIVFKISDVDKYIEGGSEFAMRGIAAMINNSRIEDGKPPMECVVVEKDWPMYESVWKAIEDWCTSTVDPVYGRFDRLTNKDISDNYRDIECVFSRKDFIAQFTYWVMQQSPYEIVASDVLYSAVLEFNEYLDTWFTQEPDSFVHFNYEQLNSMLNEDAFEKIPAINELNKPKIDVGQTISFTSRYDKPHPDYDFIDLGALSRNIFYGMLREHITTA